MRGATALIPLVGPTTLATINAFNDKPYDDKLSLSPGVASMETAARTPAEIVQLAQGKGDASKTTRDVFTTLGIITGLPLGGIGRPVSYAVDVAEGDVEPQNPVDAARGAITGTASPNSKVQ